MLHTHHNHSYIDPDDFPDPDMPDFDEDEADYSSNQQDAKHHYEFEDTVLGRDGKSIGSDENHTIELFDGSTASLTRHTIGHDDMGSTLAKSERLNVCHVCGLTVSDFNSAKPDCGHNCCTHHMVRREDGSTLCHRCARGGDFFYTLLFLAMILAFFYILSLLG